MRRLDLTDEQRRERVRQQNQAAHVRRMERYGSKPHGRPVKAMDQDELRQRRRELKRASDRALRERRKEIAAAPYSRDPPAEVVAEAARAAAAPRSLTAALCGDPPPGRRALDQRENRT